MIVLKNRREIARMREAGQVVARALERAALLVQPGVSTREIDAAIEALFHECGAEPLFKGVPGKVPFPAASCLSIDEEVIHGVPGDRKLRAGELVSIDAGCRLAGWCADAACTFPVGPIDNLKWRLLDTGRGTLELAIREFGRRNRWSEVAATMAAHVQQAGFSLVEDFVGHGIGLEMHEDPQVPNFVSPALETGDFRLVPGLVLAIEPIVNAGTKGVQLDGRDHWTVVTADRKPSVHFEHTVALTEEGPIILTRAERE